HNGTARRMRPISRGDTSRCDRSGALAGGVGGVAGVLADFFFRRGERAGAKAWFSSVNRLCAITNASNAAASVMSGISSDDPREYTAELLISRLRPMATEPTSKIGVAPQPVARPESPIATQNRAHSATPR